MPIDDRQYHLASLIWRIQRATQRAGCLLANDGPAELLRGEFELIAKHAAELLRTLDELPDRPALKVVTEESEPT